MARRIRLQMQAKKSKVPIETLCPRLARAKPRKAQSSSNAKVKQMPSLVKDATNLVTPVVVPFGVTSCPAEAVPRLPSPRFSEPMFPDTSSEDTEGIPDLVTDSDCCRRPNDCKIVISATSSDSSSSFSDDSTPRSDTTHPSPKPGVQNLHNVNVSPTAYERLCHVRNSTNEYHIANLVTSQMQHDLHNFSRPGRRVTRKQKPKKERIRN